MLDFEWDEKKNQSNKLKHGVDFELAKNVFDDDNRVEIEDNRFDYGEKRWKVIGEALNIFLAIIYTLRNTTVRIISARRASKKERKLYEEHISSESNDRL